MTQAAPEQTIGHTRANKTDAGNGSKAICRVIGASRSPSPDSGRPVMSTEVWWLIRLIPRRAFPDSTAYDAFFHALQQ